MMMIDDRIPFSLNPVPAFLWNALNPLVRRRSLETLVNGQKVTEAYVGGIGEDMADVCPFLPPRMIQETR